MDDLLATASCNECVRLVRRTGKCLSPVVLTFKQFVLDEAQKFIRLPVN